MMNRYEDRVFPEVLSVLDLARRIETDDWMDEWAKAELINVFERNSK